MSYAWLLGVFLGIIAVVTVCALRWKKVQREADERTEAGARPDPRPLTLHHVVAD